MPSFQTPKIIANEIKNMKGNKSPGVDGIPLKLLRKGVEQIRTPLAKVFHLLLEEGTVPLEWKEANIMLLFKKGTRNKYENHRPVIFLEQNPKWVDDGSPVDDVHLYFQ